MQPEELAFFASLPQMLPRYQTLREKLTAAYPDTQFKVTKTQISFRNRYVFAMASLPWRKVKGWPEEYLLVSFGLAYEKKSPRIVQAVEAYPNRWTHHVLLTCPEQVDDELMDWIGEAYRFALTLPPDRENGTYLIFETAGLETAVFLDGTEVWRSAAVQDPGTANQSQVHLPLPAGGGERLTAELRPLSDGAILPPILRLSADPADQAGTIAYANYYGLPAGAAALALALL